MNKKFLVISFLVCLIISCTGCYQIRTFMDEMKTGVEIQNKDNKKAVIEKTETYTELENQKDYTKGSDDGISLSEISDVKEGFIDNNRTLTLKDSLGIKTMTYGELAEIFNDRLKIKYNDYKLNESLMYDYVKTTEKEIIGNYLKDDIEEVRQDEQFYKDAESVEGSNTYSRSIVAVKYSDKENEEYAVGTFTSKEKGKDVELTWKTVDSNDKNVTKLTDEKNYDFSGITNFYYYTSSEDFKVRCQAPLTRFKDWLTIENAGTKTLKNIEAKVTRDVIKGGDTITEEVKVRPLDNKVNFDVTLTNNKILIEIDETDLTEALKKYYALFDNYDIKSAEYRLEIDNLGTNQNAMIENLLKEKEAENASVASLSELVAVPEEGAEVEGEEEAESDEEEKPKSKLSSIKSKTKSKSSSSKSSSLPKSKTGSKK